MNENIILAIFTIVVLIGIVYYFLMLPKWKGKIKKRIEHLIEKYGEQNIEKIQNGLFTMEMPLSLIREVYGEPDRKANKKINDRGEFEDWYYLSQSNEGREFEIERSVKLSIANGEINDIEFENLG